MCAGAAIVALFQAVISGSFAQPTKNKKMHKKAAKRGDNGELTSAHGLSYQHSTG
jgi:hypothetical protein